MSEGYLSGNEELADPPEYKKDAQLEQTHVCANVRIKCGMTMRLASLRRQTTAAHCPVHSERKRQKE